MKKLLLLSTALFSFNSAKAETKEVAQDMGFLKYDETKEIVGPADWFTGTAKISSMFSSGDNFDDYQGAMVKFEKGARTAWHSHPKGQTIYITSGEGLAQVEGQPVRKLLPGDVVWFPANVKHWHGASPTSAMSHLAIQSPDKDNQVVTWMEHVSDEDYLNTDK